jgi:hypothetical protein
MFLPPILPACLPPGVPNTFWGIIYIIIASPFLLTGGAGAKAYKRVRAMACL